MPREARVEKRGRRERKECEKVKAVGAGNSRKAVANAVRFANITHSASYSQGSSSHTPTTAVIPVTRRPSSCGDSICRNDDGGVGAHGLGHQILVEWASNSKVAAVIHHVNRAANLY